MPSLDRAEQRSLRVPRGSQDVGEDYLFLRALDCSYTSARPAEARVFFDFFSRTAPGLVEGQNRWVFQYKLRCWARMRLPNGMVARSAWKESMKPLNRLRMARCVKAIISWTFRNFYIVLTIYL